MGSIKIKYSASEQQFLKQRRKKNNEEYDSQWCFIEPDPDRLDYYCFFQKEGEFKSI